MAETLGLANVSDRSQAIVLETMRHFAQLQLWRNTFAAQWEEVAELILPTSRNTFFYQNFNWPGVKKTDRQIDATGMMALHRFAAICDSLLTPRNMTWHGLSAMDDDLKTSRETKLWFEQVVRILFKYRYAPMANFVAQNQAQFQSLGAFGTGAVFIDEFDGRQYGGLKGMRYRSIPLGEFFLTENHQGLVDGFIRWFKLTARQAAQKFGIDKLPENLHPALDQGSEWPYNFLHRCVPNDDYDPQRLDVKGKRWSSYYVSVEGQCLMTEGGYRTFPVACSRYDQAPNEPYGRSPAMMVLPALKTLNAEKRTFLKAGHRAADPVLLTADDGIVGFSMRPGALNPGGVSSDGHPLVIPLQPGNIQISKEMMAEEKSLINDAFLVSLFQILMETPQMTATEVIERTNEKGILLAPTVGRQQAEYIGPLVDRELDILAFQGLLPPMPQALRRAMGEYEIVHTSPLSRAMRAQEAAGAIRSLETAKELVAITGDPAPLDIFDITATMRGISEIQGMPESWMAGPAAIQAKAQARAKAAQAQQAIQAAPAQAAMMKAQAAQTKAGMQQPQGQPQQGVAPPDQEQPVQAAPPLTGGQ